MLTTSANGANVVGVGGHRRDGDMGVLTVVTYGDKDDKIYPLHMAEAGTPGLAPPGHDVTAVLVPVGGADRRGAVGRAPDAASGCRGRARGRGD